MDGKTYSEMLSLSEGDQFLFVDSHYDVKRLATFIRMKTKNILAYVEGETYNIPKPLFDSIVKRAEVKPKIDVTMLAGDYFYINRRGVAVLFEFVMYKGDKLYAKNLITGTPTTIDNILFAGTVKNLLKIL